MRGDQVKRAVLKRRPRGCNAKRNESRKGQAGASGMAFLAKGGKIEGRRRKTQFSMLITLPSHD